MLLTITGIDNNDNDSSMEWNNTKNGTATNGNPNPILPLTIPALIKIINETTSNS